MLTYAFLIPLPKSLLNSILSMILFLIYFGSFYISIDPSKVLSLSFRKPHLVQRSRIYEQDSLKIPKGLWGLVCPLRVKTVNGAILSFQFVADMKLMMILAGDVSNMSVHRHGAC
jgi:hypothetical protein